MTRHTQVDKLQAKNALDYQTRLLEINKQAWQEKWDAAVNPFVALIEWKADKSIRDNAYVPWLAAKRESNLCGAPSK